MIEMRQLKNAVAFFQTVSINLGNKNMTEEKNETIVLKC